MSNDEWRTPREIFDLAERVAGFRLELDAAATAQNTLCEAYYTKESNGLVMPWDKATFCNPPYSKEGGPLNKWVAKAITEVHPTVLVLPADTSTKWFARVLLTADTVVFLRPRVRFLGEDGLRGGTPKFGTLLAGWRVKAPEGTISFKWK